MSETLRSRRTLPQSDIFLEIFMATRYFGERIKRNEDPRLLTGQGLYVDDVDLPNMLHAAFVRSPYAHARINNIDASQALQRKGVAAIYTANDLGDYWKPGPLLVSPPPVKDIVFNEKTQVPLARDKVKFAGEPVVMVLAESRYIAEDALADIQVDYEPLEAVVDLEKALRPDSTLIHEEIGSNIAAHVVQRKGDFFTNMAAPPPLRIAASSRSGINARGG